MIKAICFCYSTAFVFLVTASKTEPFYIKQAMITLQEMAVFNSLYYNKLRILLTIPGKYYLQYWYSIRHCNSPLFISILIFFT